MLSLLQLLKRAGLLWILFLFIMPYVLYADADLTLVATIHLGSDSTYISSITPIGDFNADGYGDLLVGIGARQEYCLHPYEAAYLFYGGPVFDTIPDLIFKDNQNTELYCRGAICKTTYFGSTACKLSDFNDDGYDDMAIGAYAYCGNDIGTGRVYIHFGGPNPDTAVDLIISGSITYDNIGEHIIAADYNGDGLGDLLALAIAPQDGSRIFLYFGSDPPDTIFDWHYSYLYQHGITNLHGGGDINGDGYADFGWGTPWGRSLYFLGGDSIPPEPSDSLDGSWPVFTLDISGDSIDDMVFGRDGYYLALGGEPLNFDFDYPLWRSYSHSLFFYPLSVDDIIIVSVDELTHRLRLYNPGIPPDTVPIAVFNFSGYSGYYTTNIGDINYDGKDELVFTDTSGNDLCLFNIVKTAVEENGTLPENKGVFSAYPNPFNSTTIFSLNRIEAASISLYDISGRKIGRLKAVNGKAIWDASSFPSGVYFAKAETGDISKSIKLILLK